MLPFPEFGTMPPPAVAPLPAPEVAGTGGGFASALRAMFERAGLGEAAQASQVAAAGLSLEKGPGNVGKPVLAAAAGTGPDEGVEQCAVAGSPVARIWVRLERVEPVSVETAREGQADVTGEWMDGSTQNESTNPIADGGGWGASQAPEASIAEAGRDQEQSWAPLREEGGVEREPGIHLGRVDMGHQVELHPAARPDELPEEESQSLERLRGFGSQREAPVAIGPSTSQGQLPEEESQAPPNLQGLGSHRESRAAIRPAAAQDQLPEEESQPQARLTVSGSPRQANLEAERNSNWNAGRPVAPDSESDLAMAAVRGNVGDVGVRPDSGQRVTEETRDPLDLRRRSEQRIRQPAGLVEMRQPRILGSVAKNATEEEPVAFSLKAGMLGERAEGRPDNGRGEAQAVGKLSEVERLADGSAQGTRPEVRLTRDGGKRLEADRPAATIVRDGGDAREQRGPGSRGERTTEARAEVKTGETVAPARPVKQAGSEPLQRGVEAGGNAGDLVAASTPGGRIEGQVNVKQAPVAAPAIPAIRVEAAVDELQEARGAIREIRMTVEPEGGKPIRLQFKESGGQVEVTARSGDPAMTAALRADLGGLRSLGYETVRMVGGLAGPELAARPEADSGRSGEGGSQESPGHGNAGAGDASREHRGRNAARWLEAFDRQRDGEWHKEKGEQQ